MSDAVFPASANVSPGDKIADYRLQEQIGQGGMAVVYRAHDERLNLLAPALADDSAFRARFIRESRTAAAVEHRPVRRHAGLHRP
jgi:serine/threonine protein kinase